MALLQACKNKDILTILDKINRHNAIYVAENCDDDPMILKMVFKIAKLKDPEEEIFRFIVQNKKRIDIFVDIYGNEYHNKLLPTALDNLDMFQYICKSTSPQIIFYVCSGNDINYDVLKFVFSYFDKTILEPYDVDEWKDNAYWNEPLLHNITKDKLTEQLLLEYLEKYPDDDYKIFQNFEITTANPQILKHYNLNWDIEITSENIQMILPNIKWNNKSYIDTELFKFKETLDYIPISFKFDFKYIINMDTEFHPAFVLKYQLNTYPDLRDNLINTVLDMKLPIIKPPRPFKIKTKLRLLENNINFNKLIRYLADEDIQYLKQLKEFTLVNLLQFGCETEHIIPVEYYKSDKQSYQRQIKIINNVKSLVNKIIKNSDLANHIVSFIVF